MPVRNGEPESQEFHAAGPMLFFDQRLIDSLSVAIYTCDAQGRIRLYNKAAVELWGREPEPGVDMWCGSWRIFDLDGSPMALGDCPMAVALKEGRPVIGREIIVERPDGSRRHVWPHPSPVFDLEGKIIGAVNLLIEVPEGTPSSTAPENGAAESALKVREDFFSVLSHELRTPLTPALISLEGMEVDPMLPENLRRNIAMVRRNVELEARIIDDLLDLGRLSRRELKLFIEPVTLNDGLRDVCDICRPQILERGLRLELRLDPAVGQVLADSARLQQVMWSLLKSAIKYTPPHGTVAARTFRKNSGMSGFEINDSGAAITPEAGRRLLNPFMPDAPTTERQFPDRLGLAVAKSLIELQHGTIEVEAGARGGVRFTVELPASLSGRTGVASGVSVGTVRKRLLLVEDHCDTATALSRYLELSGFAVRSVNSFPEAIALLGLERFDLVISDIGLGDMSGCDLMREVHQHWNVPGIAVSGYGSDRDIRQSYDAGFSEHLVKPLKLAQLLETVTRLLASGSEPPVLAGVEGDQT